jgi:cation:H+ antiporter
VTQILIFFAGLVGLWLGAEFIIRGSLGLAKRFGLSEGFIGLVILSLGTGLPEIMVSVTAAREQLLTGADASGIVIGNVIGSTMSQMVFVLGAVGMFGGIITIKKKEAWIGEEADGCLHPSALSF